MSLDEPRIRTFLVILLIIGVLASLYMPAKVYELTLKIYSGTASPYNIDYMGTSLFYTYLKRSNYRVEVYSEWDKLVSSAGNDSAILIIAPDKPLSRMESVELLDLVVNHGVDVVVADENITSNNFLNLLGINISGHAILYGLPGYENPYPPAIYFRIDDPSLYRRAWIGRGVELLYPIDYRSPSETLRLNWASNIRFTGSTPATATVRYRVFLLSTGAIDYNDDEEMNDVFNVTTAIPLPEGGSDLLVNNEYLVYWGAMYYVVVGVVVYTSGGRVVVLSDSFLFTNQAYTMPGANETYRGIVDDILKFIGRERILIDNSHYKSSIKKIGIPFHPAMIIYFVSSGLHTFDSILTDLVVKNQFIAFIIGIGIILAIALTLQYTLGFKSLRSISVSRVDEIVFMAETRVRRGLLKREKGFIKPREAIIDLWRLLDYVFYKVTGLELEKIYSDPKLLDKVSRTLGIDREIFSKNLKWLYMINQKAAGKRRLPLIIFWGRTLSKYINRVEHILELMGYSITRRAGYRGIEEILH